MKSFVPANAIAAVISVTSTMAHALCHRAFASCSRSISVSFSLLLPTCFPHSKFSFFCTSANTPYIKGIHSFSHQRREENQLHKFILILLYFDEKIKCIPTIRINIYVQTCDPPPIFLGKFDRLDKVQLNFVFFGINSLYFVPLLKFTYLLYWNFNSIFFAIKPCVSCRALHFQITALMCVINLHVFFKILSSLLK